MAGQVSSDKPSAGIIYLSGATPGIQEIPCGLSYDISNLTHPRDVGVLKEMVHIRRECGRAGVWNTRGSVGGIQEELHWPSTTFCEYGKRRRSLPVARFKASADKLGTASPSSRITARRFSKFRVQPCVPAQTLCAGLAGPHSPQCGS